MPDFKLNKDDQDQPNKHSSPEYLRDESLSHNTDRTGRRRASKKNPAKPRHKPAKMPPPKRSGPTDQATTGFKKSLQSLKIVARRRGTKNASLLLFIAVVAVGFFIFLVVSMAGLLKLEHVKTVLVEYNSQRLNFSLETAAARIIETEADQGASTTNNQNRTLSDRLNRFDAEKLLRELDRTSQLKYKFSGTKQWQNRTQSSFIGISDETGRIIPKTTNNFTDILRTYVVDAYQGRNMFLRRRVALLTRNVYGARLKGWYKTAEEFDLQPTASGTKSNAGATNKRGRSTVNTQSDSSSGGDGRLKGLDNQDLIYGISDYIANYAWLPGFVEGAADHYKLSSSRLLKGAFVSADPRPAYDFISNFKNSSGGSSDIIMSCLALNLADDYILTLSNYRTAELMRIAYTFNASADQQKRGDTVSAAVDQRVNDLSNAENVCDYQKAVGDKIDPDCLQINKHEQPLQIGGLLVQDGASKVAPVRQYKKGCQFALGALIQGEKSEEKLMAAFKGGSGSTISNQIKGSLKPGYGPTQNREEYEKLVIPSVVKTISGLAYFNDSNDRWGVYISAGEAIIAEAHSRRSGGHVLDHAQVDQLDGLIVSQKSSKKEYSNSRNLLFAKLSEFLPLGLKKIFPNSAVAQAEGSDALDFPHYGFTKDEINEIATNPQYTPREVARRVDTNPNKTALINLYDKCSKRTEPEILYNQEDCTQLNNMADAAIKDLNYYVLYDSAMDMIDSTQDSFPSSDIMISRPLP